MRRGSSREHAEGAWPPPGARRGNAKQQSAEGLVADAKFVFAQERAANLIPAAFLVFGLLDAVPIPTDVGFFYVQRWLDEHRDDLTDREFWFYQYLNYYGWDVAWYMALFTVTYFTGQTVGEKALIGLGIVSVGAIATEILRFASKDAQRRKRGPAVLPPGPTPTPTTNPRPARARRLSLRPV